jgi:hypothetical protein
MVFNRPVRDALPAHRWFFAPEWQLKTDILEKKGEKSKEIQIEHYNRTAHPLQPFGIRDHVIFQHPVSKCWATPAVVVEIGPNRDYIIKTAAGRLCVGNVAKTSAVHARKTISGAIEPAGPNSTGRQSTRIE